MLFISLEDILWKLKRQCIILTCHIHPSKEMNITTPMNCVKRMSGVKKDHTGHSAKLKLQGKHNDTYKYAQFELVNHCWSTIKC